MSKAAQGDLKVGNFPVKRRPRVARLAVTDTKIDGAKFDY